MSAFKWTALPTVNLMWVRHALALSLLAWMVHVPCSASAETDFLIDVWDTEKGLPDSTVTAIQQTRDGYLWVGTYNGLARFDGIQFEVFDSLNTAALTHPRVQALFVDANGILWINTFDGSLTSYHSGQFRLEHQETMSSDVRVSMIVSTTNQTVFSSQIGQLLRRRGQSSDWERFLPEDSPRPTFYFQDGQGQVWWHSLSQAQYGRLKDGQLEMIEGESANFLTVDSAGRLWVGTDTGIGRWGNGEYRLLTPTNGEAELNVEFILPLGGQTNWVWANERLRKQEGRVWVTEVEAWQGLLGTDAGRYMGAHVDAHGGVWFNHYGNGLFYISPEGEPRRLTREDGLPGNRVGAWFADREGNIWVGVDRGGLGRLRPGVFQVIGEAQGLPAQAVSAVMEDGEEGVWASTFGSGVHRWQEGTVRQVPLQSRAGRFVFSLCELEPGVLWMSAGDEDLYVLDGEGFRRAPWDAHGVKALLKDPEGRLWAGLKNGVGYWDPIAGQATALEEGFETAAVRVLSTSGGVVWFGSDDGSLYEYFNGNLQRHRAEDSLSYQPIWSLWPEADGTVWIGTFRGGLLRFKDGEFTRYSLGEGLPSDIISQILDDGQGRLWCGSDRGLFHVNKTDLNEFARGERTRVEAMVYGLLDGLPSLDFSGGYNPSCLRAQDSRLWFATAKGLVSVDPESIGPGVAPPPAAIQDMRIDGIKQFLAHPGSEGASGKEPLEVAPGRRQFRFEYTALNLSSPDKVRFRHRLVGHDLDWIEAGTRRDAIYSSLPPGNYEFQVTACSSEGVWNTELATVRFELLPQFYETWWFFGAIGLTLLSVVVFAVRRVATSNLRRELAMAEQQHAIELDRARIAKDIHDDLGAGLTEISLLSELAQRDTQEDAPGYLGQISTAARGLVRAMDETVWAVNPENDTLEGLITYVSKLAQDYLGVAGIRCRLDVPTRVPEVWIAADVRHHLYLAIKESLNNIVKHSRATEATLRLGLAPGQYTLTIEDNGCGLKTASSDAPGEMASMRLDGGHGLQNLERRLQESGGRCVVQSAPGRGTRIELIMKAKGLSPELAGDKPRTKE